MARTLQADRAVMSDAGQEHAERWTEVQEMAALLEGVRVLDCGRWMMAPACARILADLGADVIKVEDRVGGDPLRGLSQVIKAQTLPAAADASPAEAARANANTAFYISNRNKRSIGLDLTKARGRDIVHKLVEKADVLVQNWRASAAERLGMDYETLSPHNPRLIYIAASGWGPEGPESEQPAMDGSALARSGMMYLWGSPDMPPVQSFAGLADMTGATVMTIAVLAALLARGQGATGQEVDVSLLGSLVGLEAPSLQLQLVRGWEGSRVNRAKAWNPLNNHYKCADDKWISLCMLQADRYWPALCSVMDIQTLEKDPRFENMLLRSQNAEELFAILDTIFASKPRAEWARLFEENDLIYAPVQTIAEVVDDPQVLANDYVIDFDHSEWGKARTVGFPYRFSATPPPPLAMQAPEFAQHTEEVLLEIGYTWHDIARLKDEEVI
jgi:crotonobetainyl-CoA:carnitine CoA-transferase CaiB-like acyl-CoA transferase